MASTVGRKIRNNIVVGLVLVTPAAISLFIIAFLIRLIADNAMAKAVTNTVFRTLPEAFQEPTVKFFLGRILALVLVLLFLFLVGFFVRSFFGRKLYRIGEKVLTRIPVFNRIYVQVRHISETIFAQRETMFKEVVLVEYPRKGIYSLGFVTSTVPDHFRSKTTWPQPEEKFVALFVPTTPNPTSGFMLMSPRSELITLPISVPDAMKLVISVGAVFPGEEGDFSGRPTLLDKLEAWITRETKLEPVQPKNDREGSTD